MLRYTREWLARSHSRVAAAAQNAQDAAPPRSPIGIWMWEGIPSGRFTRTPVRVWLPRTPRWPGWSFALGLGRLEAQAKRPVPCRPYLVPTSTPPLSPLRRILLLLPARLPCSSRNPSPLAPPGARRQRIRAPPSHLLGPGRRSIAMFEGHVCSLSPSSHFVRAFD
jgi:hypothetical protein